MCIRDSPTTVTIDGHAIPAGGAMILLNPGLVRPGTKVGVSGFGFDPGSMVDLVVKTNPQDRGSAVGLVKADENGSISANITIPDSLSASSAIVVAQQRNSSKSAKASAVVPGGIGFVKLSKDVVKPGDSITLTAKGFTPSETIDVFWGRLTGEPAAKLQADGSGAVGQASVRVGVSAVGSATMALIGEKSQTVATAQVTMLGLYPTIDVKPYAVKAAQRLGFSGKGFAPGEGVAVYINSTDAQPVMTVQTDPNGNFSDAGFVVPFGLRKSETLILIGQESRSVVSSGFDILPYTPSAQPSTYGGFPGTTLSFYANGFAPNEVVLVYKGRTENNPGELVTAFRVDGKGNVGAAGNYMIPADAQGKVIFGLVGRLSGSTATASVTVQHSDVQVSLPAQSKYVLPADLATDPTLPGQQPASGTATAPRQTTVASSARQSPSASATAPPQKQQSSSNGSLFDQILKFFGVGN